MIIGIVETGTGIEAVRQFAAADSVAQGLADFVASYTPPLNPADFIAFDTGWPGPGAERPGAGKIWGYDRDASTLVAIDAPPTPIFAAASKMQASTITAQSWETVDGLVTSIGAFTANADAAIGQAIGQVRVEGVGFEMRLVKGSNPGVPMSQNYGHADTGGAFEIFTFYSDQAPDLGVQTYRLEARLNGATSAEIRFASMSISINGSAPA